MSYLSDIPIISIADRTQRQPEPQNNGRRFGMSRMSLNALEADAHSLQDEVGRLTRSLAESETMNERLKRALVDAARYERQTGAAVQETDRILKVLINWIEKARGTAEDRVQRVLTGALSGSIDKDEGERNEGLDNMKEISMATLENTGRSDIIPSLPLLFDAVKSLVDVSLRLAPSITAFASAKMERIHFESEQLNSQRAELRQQLIRLNEMEAVLEGRRAALRDWVQRLEGAAKEGVGEMERLHIPECLSIESSLPPLPPGAPEEKLVERVVKEVEFMRAGFHALSTRMENNILNNTKGVQTSQYESERDKRQQNEFQNDQLPSPSTRRIQHSSRMYEIDSLQKQRAFNRLNGISNEQRYRGLENLGVSTLTRNNSDPSLTEYLKTRIRDSETSREDFHPTLRSTMRTWDNEDNGARNTIATARSLRASSGNMLYGDKSIGPATKMLSEIGWSE